MQDGNKSDVAEEENIKKNCYWIIKIRVSLPNVPKSTETPDALHNSISKFNINISNASTYDGNGPKSVAVFFFYNRAKFCLSVQSSRNAFS